jgi:hypothetical protein
MRLTVLTVWRLVVGLMAAAAAAVILTSPQLPWYTVVFGRDWVEAGPETPRSPLCGTREDTGANSAAKDDDRGGALGPAAVSNCPYSRLT